MGNRKLHLSLAAVALLGATGCDYSGDWLFAGAVDGVRGVDHLGVVQPAVATTPAELEAAMQFSQLGPTGTAFKGGATFGFVGTGTSVCVWVDPELVFWSESVGVASPTPNYTLSDNHTDDGDLDLSVGLAVYYTGTAATEEEGGEIGDFRVRVQDSLDQQVTIAFNECVIPTMLQDSGGHAGRGAPEYCTISNTQPGVSYLVLMETFSTPLDDDLLSYGYFIAEGTCSELQEMMGAPTGPKAECMIRGESRDPDDLTQPRAGSEDVEDAYCADFSRTETPVRDYCRAELDARAAGEIDCEVDDCYCGDPADSPN